jgi:hypothetical protein
LPNNHGIDVARFFVEHLAEVRIAWRLVVLAESLGGALGIGIRQCDDVLGHAALDVGSCAPACANRGDVELFIGRLVAHRSQRGRAAEAARGNRARQQRAVEKMAP